MNNTNPRGSACRFLDAIVPALIPGETVELRGIHAISRTVNSTWHTSPASLTRQADLLTAANFHVYIGINPRRGRGRGNANVSRISALAADIDEKLFATQNQFCDSFESVLSTAHREPTPEETRGFECFESPKYNIPHEALKAVGACLIRPTLEVCSGGGIQPYWILAEPLENTEDNRQRCAVLGHRLARLVTGPERKPDNISNVERVLRLPDSFNFKYEPAREVLLIRDDGPRYTIGELESWLDAHAAWTAPEPPRAYEPRPAQDGVIADFNARYDALPLLLRHGARIVHQSGGEVQLAKPGHIASGATWGHRPGTLIVFYANWEPFTVPGKKGYDAFEVFNLLEHGGDRGAAYRAAKGLGYGVRFGLAVTTMSNHDATRRLLARAAS